MAIQDSDEAARALASRTGVTYRLVLDAEGSLYRDVKAFGMPVTLIVTADGHIAKKVSGGLDAGSLRNLILDHLFEPV